MNITELMIENINEKIKKEEERMLNHYHSYIKDLFFKTFVFKDTEIRIINSFLDVKKTIDNYDKYIFQKEYEWKLTIATSLVNSIEITLEEYLEIENVLFNVKNIEKIDEDLILKLDLLIKKEREINEGNR